MSIAIYDILSENNNYSEKEAYELTMKIIDLAKRDL
jgi:hypothetical protein